MDRLTDSCPIHVYPQDDEHPHYCTGLHCECAPKLITLSNGRQIIVHNAYDCREILEEAELIKNTAL